MLSSRGKDMQKGGGIHKVGREDLAPLYTRKKDGV